MECYLIESGAVGLFRHVAAVDRTSGKSYNKERLLTRYHARVIFRVSISRTIYTCALP